MRIWWWWLQDFIDPSGAPSRYKARFQAVRTETEALRAEYQVLRAKVDADAARFDEAIRSVLG